MSATGARIRWTLMTALKPYLRNKHLDKFKATLIKILNFHGEDDDWKRFGRRRLLETRYGFKMYADMVNGYHRSLYFTGEYYEIAYGRLVAQIISPLWIFVDVGANVGFYTLLAATLSHHVYSFEPNPSLHEWLRSNIAENEFGNVTVLDYGLSDQKTVLNLQQSETSLGEATLRGGVTFDKTISIPVDRGDNVFSDLVPDRPIFIKIDVEGWEHKVLLGFERILSRRDVVVTAEITDDWLRSAGSSAAQLFDSMKTLGYHAYEIQQPPTRIKTAPRLVKLQKPLQKFQYDVCFIKFDNLDDFWAWTRSLKPSHL